MDPGWIVGRQRQVDDFNACRIKRRDQPIRPCDHLLNCDQAKGVAELQKILLSRPEQFVTTVTEKLLTYALGRGLEYYDQPAVRSILRDAAPKNYRWSALIVGVVKSTPFQMRTGRDRKTAVAALP